MDKDVGGKASFLWEPKAAGQLLATLPQIGLLAAVDRARAGSAPATTAGWALRGKAGPRWLGHYQIRWSDPCSPKARANLDYFALYSKVQPKPSQRIFQPAGLSSGLLGCLREFGASGVKASGINLTSHASKPQLFTSVAQTGTRSIPLGLRPCRQVAMTSRATSKRVEGLSPSVSDHQRHSPFRRSSVTNLPSHE